MKLKILLLLLTFSTLISASDGLERVVIERSDPMFADLLKKHANTIKITKCSETKREFASGEKELVALALARRAGKITFEQLEIFTDSSGKQDFILTVMLKKEYV